jgi:hypothetical protein
MYESHGVFAKGGQGIYTTPCVHGGDCPYCAAVQKYWDAYNADNTDEDSKTIASQLSKKERYLIGFINLEDKSPIVLDFSKKQANALISVIKKNVKKIDKFAFEVSKSGTGQGTIVSLDIIVDPDEDLTDAQRKNFEDSANMKWEDEFFEVLPVKTIAEGIEDLRKFGFDISLISSAAPSQPAANETNEAFQGLDELF